MQDEVMRIIYKYPFRLVQVQDIQLPDSFKPVLIDVQGGMPCLWAEIDPMKNVRTHQLWVFPTGYSFDSEGMSHIGSFQDGPFVWHVYVLVSSLDL